MYNVITETNVGINDVKVSEDPSRQASKVRGVLTAGDMPCLSDRIVKSNKIKAAIISERKYAMYLGFLPMVTMVAGSLISIVLCFSPGFEGGPGAVVFVGTATLQGLALYFQGKSNSHFFRDDIVLSCVGETRKKEV